MATQLSKEEYDRVIAATLQFNDRLTKDGIGGTTNVDKEVEEWRQTLNNMPLRQLLLLHYSLVRYSLHKEVEYAEVYQQQVTYKHSEEQE